MADRGKSAARVDWQQTFLLTVAFVFELARPNFAHAYNFHPAGGMGFRAIADPFVVGFVDVGYGDEGIAIFSGIDYPF